MISRRDLLKLSGLVGLVPSFPALARELAAPDYKIEIAPVTIEVTNRTNRPEVVHRHGLFAPPDVERYESDTPRAAPTP